MFWLGMIYLSKVLLPHTAESWTISEFLLKLVVSRSKNTEQLESGIGLDGRGMKSQLSGVSLVAMSVS